MFSLHSINGRLFTGTLEQWRQVARVSAPNRAQAIGPALQEPREPAREVGDRPAGGNADPAQRQAIAAYTQTLQGAAPRHRLTRVDDVMSRRVVSVPQQASAAQAWQLLAEQGVAQAPVVDDSGALVGLLLRSDLLPAPALAAPVFDTAALQQGLARAVGELMWTPVPSVAPDADLRRVASVLVETGLPGLPVADAEGALIGFIARTDILRAVVADPPLELWA